MSLRLPKPARLGETSEFARVRTEGASYPGRYFILAVLRGAQGEEPARVGLITSKKVGDSVKRHRVRRRMRELFRLARPLLCPGLWVVLIGRAAAAAATFQALQQEWQTLGKRGRIFVPPPAP